MMRAVWLWTLLAGVVQAAEPLVSIGHIPIAVRNLDAASADFRAFGFTLKPGHLGYRSLLLPPSATHGLWLEFRQVDTGHH